MQSLHRDNLGDVGPIGGEPGMTILFEMKFLVDDHDQFVKSLKPNVGVLQWRR